MFSMVESFKFRENLSLFFFLYVKTMQTIVNQTPVINEEESQTTGKEVYF